MILFFKVFLTEFIAEMGDKTQLMLIALTSKYKLRDIILGTAAAILVLNGLAVLAGGLVSEFIPGWLIKIIAALAFLYFAASTLAGDDDEEEEGSGRSKIRFAPLAVFCTFFVAELGDKTQLTAITFGANEGMSSALIVWLGCSRHPGNAFRLSVKEQDSGRTAQYSRLRHLLSIRCLHTVSGTEAHQYRYPFHPGTADTDRCNDCFCRYLCVPVFKEREKGKSSKLKTNPILFSRNGVYLPISFGTQKKNSTHNHPFQGHPAGRSQYN